MDVSLTLELQNVLIGDVEFMDLAGTVTTAHLRRDFRTTLNLA